MSENIVNYHCPIWITDFTDGGAKPFQCSHLLCDDCERLFRYSNLRYKCPICKSEPNMTYKITNMTYEPPEEEINHHPT